jgi:acetyl/propionyl-CoA carboxylase alpha subunit
VYAEDPDNQDLPSPGRILLCVPPQGPGVRFDAGIETGSEVTVHYDPLLAKLITWGRDRSEAIERMSGALRDAVVLGVRTNLSRLQDIVGHVAFREGALHTGFLDEHASEWRAQAALSDVARDAVARALRLDPKATSVKDRAPDPWATLGAWRVGGA